MRALRRGLQETEDQFPQDVLEILHYFKDAEPQQRIVATPGQGTHVPVWLLGSSLFSAQLAAKLGLPYSFASHFAPRMLAQAIQLYRDNFEPSEYLERPYVSMGVPTVVADTDHEAEFLATQCLSACFRFNAWTKPKTQKLPCRKYGRFVVACRKNVCR